MHQYKQVNAIGFGRQSVEMHGAHLDRGNRRHTKAHAHRCFPFQHEMQCEREIHALAAKPLLRCPCEYGVCKRDSRSDQAT